MRDAACPHRSTQQPHCNHSKNNDVLGYIKPPLTFFFLNPGLKIQILFRFLSQWLNICLIFPSLFGCMILRTIVFIPLDLIILLEDRSLSSAYVLHIELCACSVTAARTLVFWEGHCQI